MHLPCMPYGHASVLASWLSELLHRQKRGVRLFHSKESDTCAGKLALTSHMVSRVRRSRAVSRQVMACTSIAKRRACTCLGLGPPTAAHAVCCRQPRHLSRCDQ